MADSGGWIPKCYCDSGRAGQRYAWPPQPPDTVDPHLTQLHVPRTTRVAAALVVVLVVATIGLMHAWLAAKQREAGEQVVAETDKRATQLVGAVAERVGVLVRNADFALGQLRIDYGQDDARFSVLSESLVKLLPQRALVQLSFADADGNLTYSNLGPTGNISIRDREHFKVHLDGGDRLFISKPLLGRVSKTWSIQFSRPLIREGRFAGVAVLSVAPEYLAHVLAGLELDAQDVIAVFDTDGTYFARSNGHDKVIGRALATTRPFMEPGAAPSGSFRASAFADGVERLFAWQFIPGTPLVANVGLALGPALGPIDNRFDQERRGAWFFSALLLILGASVLGLLWGLERRQREVMRSEARFRSLPRLSSDWYWEQDANLRCVAFGVTLNESTRTGAPSSSATVASRSAVTGPTSSPRISSPPWARWSTPTTRHGMA